MTASRQSSMIGVQHVHKTPIYEGSDLKNIQCPQAYNMRLFDFKSNGRSIPPGYPHEIQTITCIASGGYFTLTFRGETTGHIMYSASVIDLKNALESLTTIGSVTVTISNSLTTVCSTSPGAVSTIVFNSDYGNLPGLAAVSSLTGSPSLIVGRIMQGSNGPYECGGKGSCNRETGECECWNQYGSSDGFGGPGLLCDCGHNLAY